MLTTTDALAELVRAYSARIEEKKRNCEAVTAELSRLRRNSARRAPLEHRRTLMHDDIGRLQALLDQLKDFAVHADEYSDVCDKIAALVIRRHELLPSALLQAQLKTTGRDGQPCLYP